MPAMAPLLSPLPLGLLLVDGKVDEIVVGWREEDEASETEGIVGTGVHLVELGEAEDEDGEEVDVSEMLLSGWR